MKKFLSVFLLSAFLFSANSQNINPTGSLSVPRWKHESVMLNDGKVLVFGGNDGAVSPVAYSSAELYVPGSGAWLSTGNMVEQRYEMASALLPNGNVIAIGGQFGNYYGSMTSEVYNVSAGTWSKVDSMNRVRYGHRAVKLNNGKILIAGGLPATNTSEIYDPVANTWTYTGNMNVTRNEGISLTLLNNGKVLAAGGNSPSALNTAEIYDPSTGTWTSVPGTMNGKRYLHSAILLNNGNVLLSGSSDLSNGDDKTSEIYNPSTNAFTPTGSLQQTRINNSVVKLGNGNILIYGWGDNASPSNTKCIEIYNATSGTWSTSQMYNIIGTVGYSINKLNNGKILVAGGKPMSVGASALCKLINDNTVSGTDDINSGNNGIFVYPNPAKDYINFDFNLCENVNNLHLSICDINGRKITDVNELSDFNRIDISSLTKGIYFWKIYDLGNNINFKGKFIVE